MIFPKPSLWQSKNPGKHNTKPNCFCYIYVYVIWLIIVYRWVKWTIPFRISILLDFCLSMSQRTGFLLKYKTHEVFYQEYVNFSFGNFQLKISFL